MVSKADDGLLEKQKNDSEIHGQKFQKTTGHTSWPTSLHYSYQWARVLMTNWRSGWHNNLQETSKNTQWKVFWWSLSGWSSWSKQPSEHPCLFKTTTRVEIVPANLFWGNLSRWSRSLVDNLNLTVYPINRKLNSNQFSLGRGGTVGQNQGAQYLN